MKLPNLFRTLSNHNRCQAYNSQSQAYVLLCLFDKYHGDITNATQYCSSPSCLGEPWCSACQEEQTTIGGDGPPKSDTEVLEAHQNSIPKNTTMDTKYCVCAWEAWRQEVPSLLEIGPETMSCWSGGVEGKWNGIPTKCTLPHCMWNHATCKKLHQQRPRVCRTVQNLGCRNETPTIKRAETYPHKQAEPFTIEEENVLWDRKALGDHTPQSLLNYMNGLYFALCSGEEHQKPLSNRGH